tara:strand:- start:346 stop:657 length:312 start_codon:yes stop_codon:yes gene_type:complete
MGNRFKEGMTLNDEKSTKPVKKLGSEVVRVGTLGVYADDPSQVWAVLLTFLTLFIWLVHLNNDLGDQVFRSILTVSIFSIGTFGIYKFWAMFYRKMWKKIWKR